MPWYIYAILATALYGVTNFIEKYVLDKHVPDALSVMAIGCFMNGILGMILFLFFPQFRINNFLQIGLLLLSGALMVIYVFPYFKALLIDDVSMIVPLFQFICVFVLIFEAIFLGKFLTIKQLFGAAIIIFSGLMLGNTHIKQVMKPRKSFWLVMLSCFLVSFCIIIFKGVSESFGFWTSMTYNLLGGGIFGLFLLLFPNNRKKIFSVDFKSVGLILLIDDCIDMTARFLYFFGATLTMATLVQLIGGAQSFIVLIFGIFLTLLFPKVIKEDIRWSVIKNKLLVGVVMILGLWLVYF